MNYYERHIGDYLKDTAHLSLLEHGVYTRLLDVYYTRETPLPKSEVARLIGARSNVEREALNAVLAEFFTLEADAYVQHRCDNEILKCADKSGKAKRSALARWDAKRLQSESNADGMRTHSEGNANGMLPIPSHQTPDPIKKEPNGSLSPAKLPTCPTKSVIDLYHEVLPELPTVRLINTARSKAIASLWKFVLTTNTPEGTPRATTAADALTWIKTYFERARANDFLMGRGQKSADHAGWECDIDFLMSQKGMKQVIEKTRTS